MMLEEKTKEKMIETILPFLKKIIDNSPQYGEISLRIKICDYKVGSTIFGIETSHKIEKTKE